MKKILLVGSLASLIFVLIFLKDVFININKPLAQREEVTWQYFIFDNNFKKLEKLDIQNLYESRMYYGHKNTVIFGNSLLGQAIIGLPFYLLTKNVILAANIVIILEFYLAFLFAYLLTFKITKSISSSLIGALIFTYNPYVLAHFGGHEQMALQWIPFLFLIAEIIISRGPSLKTSLLFFLGFIFLLMSSFNYTFFVLTTLPVYIAARLIFQKMSSPKHLLSKYLLFFLGLTIIFSLIYLSPFLEVRKNYQVKRNMVLNILHSANPEDFIFTSAQNYLWGNLAKQQIYGNLRSEFFKVHWSEHSLFPGLIATILLILSLVFLISKKFKRAIKPKVQATFILLLTAVVLSFGPYLIIASTKIPLPYMLLYEFAPFVNTTRAPSRFMAVGFLAIALLSAFAWLNLGKKFKKRALLFLILALTLITLEYRQQLYTGYLIPRETLSFYSWLKDQKEIKIILELPFANDFEGTPYDRSGLDESIYLLYALYHDKYLLNGHHSFIPLEADKLGKLLAVGFPTQENLNLLKNLGVDLIIVHKNEY